MLACWAETAPPAVSALEVANAAAFALEAALELVCAFPHPANAMAHTTRGIYASKWLL
jgi:hypothetical protein